MIGFAWPRVFERALLDQDLARLAALRKASKEHRRLAIAVTKAKKKLKLTPSQKLVLWLWWASGNIPPHDLVIHAFGFPTFDALKKPPSGTPQPGSPGSGHE